MSSSSRRTFFRSLGLGAAAVLGGVGRSQSAESETAKPLPIEQYEPKSMLQVAEHPVDQAKFPVIDAHTHVSSVLSREPAPEAELQGSPEERLDQIVAWMDELNMQTLVNLTGGSGENLDRVLEQVVAPHEGRIVTCAQPDYSKLNEPDYPKWQAAELERAKKAGAVGLKILKSLGVGVRENGKTGPLVKIDDERFDPMWEAAGELGMPVFIHTSDPDAFFTPIDRYNERWEELANHPDWSFYGSDFPTKPELLAARNRVIERRPNTRFVGLHVGNHPEKLDEVSGWLDQYSNFSVEIGARIGELGRQPRRARKFFEDYPERILFGTDATPNGTSVPQQDLTPAMYRVYFRFLETLDEYFDYSPAPVPPQGRWKIYGVGLPDAILRNVYHDNAARLFGWDLLG